MKICIRRIYIKFAINQSRRYLKWHLQTHPPTPIPRHCFLVGNVTQVKFLTSHFSSLSIPTLSSSATKNSNFNYNQIIQNLSCNKTLGHQKILKNPKRCLPDRIWRTFSNGNVLIWSANFLTKGASFSSFNG